MSGDTLGYLFYLGLLLLFIGGGFLYGHRENLSKTVQQAAIWVLIFLGFIIAYGFSDTIRGQLTPSRAVQSAEGYTVRRADDGHFYLNLQINGADVRFVVDTGATDMVLTMAAARKVGLTADELDFYGRANTANGKVRTAPVVLEEVRLGDLVDRRVRASVNEGEMRESLLGMSYLSRFSSIKFEQNRLILQP